MAWLGQWFQQTFVPPAADTPTPVRAPAAGAPSSSVDPFGATSAGGYGGGYGGASASTADAANSGSTGQQVSAEPTPEERAAMAKEVNALAGERLKKAWINLGNELITLKKIWESQDVLKKNVSQQERSSRDNLVRSMEDALQASKKDPISSVKMISPILQGAQWSQDKEKILNQATENAAQNLIKKERQSQHCHKLAAMLKAQGKPRVQQNELESLVAACLLANQGLESRIRKALGMAKTKEEQRQERKEAADMEKRATKELLAQLAEAAGTSRENAKKAMESAGGDPDLALVMLLSDPDEAKRREKREAAAAKKKDQKLQAAEKAAKETEQMKKEKLAEAKKLAISVASLASLTQKMAWAQVQIELDAQIAVWHTQATMSAAMGGASLSYEETQREVQSVVTTAARDPRNAVFLLEVALQQTMDRGLELCTGMLVAADGVLEAESIAESRKELAKRLKDLVKALETGKENQIRLQDPTALIAACKLKDATTETSAQMLLTPRNVSL